MPSPLQQMLDELRKREVYKNDAIPTGLVKLEDAEDILQTLEIKLLNERDGAIFKRNPRVLQSISQDKAKIVRVGTKKHEGHSGANG